MEIQLGILRSTISRAKCSSISSLRGDLLNRERKFKLHKRGSFIQSLEFTSDPRRVLDIKIIQGIIPSEELHWNTG